MSAPDILANLRRGWNRNPSGVAHGTARTGVSAALWTHDVDEVQEVSSGPDADHHLVAFQLNRFRAETFYNERLAFAGEHGAMSFNIVPAGVKPRAVISGAFRTLHIYLPSAFVDGICTELGRPFWCS